MSLVHATATILAKELRTEFRSRELLGTTIVFVLIVIVLFSFTFNPTSSESRRFGPGLLWLAFLFGGSLMFQCSFLRGESHDTVATLPVLGQLLLVLALGTVGLAATGTVFSAVAAQARLRELLLPLLLLPVLAPVLIASTEATIGVLQDPSELSLVWLTFLGCFDLIFLTEIGRVR